MHVKDKRVLKNGAIGGYVKQPDGSYKWRIVGHSSAKKKKAPTTKKKVPTTKKKAGKKIQMKGGDLTGVDDSELRRIVNQKNRLLSFVKIKLDTYKKSKHSNSNQKKEFEKLLDDLVDIDNNNILLQNARIIENVLEKIVRYYNQGTSKNLKFLAGTQKRLSSLFHVYRIVKSVDSSFIDFDGKVEKEYRKYNRKMSKKNENKAGAREVEKWLLENKNYDLEKMEKKVHNFLEHVNKSDKREVNKMIKTIESSALSDRAKYNIMNLIFLEGISYNELETRLRHSSFTDRQTNNILRGYRNLKTKLDIAREAFVKNRGKQRIDSIKRTKNSKIMKKLMNNKSFNKLEKTELKKYKFDISDKIRQDSDRKLYNYYGQTILKDKYNKFLGVQNNDGRGHLKNIFNYNNIKKDIENYQGFADDLIDYRKKYEYHKLLEEYPNIQKSINEKNQELQLLKANYRSKMNQQLKTNVNVKKMNKVEQELKGLKNARSKISTYREKFRVNLGNGNAKNMMKLYEKFTNNSDINLSELRYNFMMGIFNLFLCYESDRNNQVCKKYYTKIKLNNDLYTNIMKKAGKYSGNSHDNEVAYRMYFIYNQIRDRNIIKKDIEYIANLAKECNIKQFNNMLKEKIQRENEYRYANVNGRKVRVLYDPSINNNIEVVNGSRVVNNPTRNANVVQAVHVPLPDSNGNGVQQHVVRGQRVVNTQQRNMNRNQNNLYVDNEEWNRLGRSHT